MNSKFIYQNLKFTLFNSPWIIVVVPSCGYAILFVIITNVKKLWIYKILEIYETVEMNLRTMCKLF